LFALIMLIIQIVLFVVSLFMNKPAFENAQPKSLGDFQFPTAVETRAIPIVWGTTDIRGPNVIWYGDLKIIKITRKVKSGFSSKKVTVGFRYFVGMHLLLCYGPIDRVVRLEISDKEASTDVVGPFGDTGVDYVINAPSLLGGKEKGGGVRGTFRIYGGRPNQIEDPYLITRGPGLGDATLIPGYVDLAHAVWEQGEVGESTSIGAYIFRVTRFPDNLGLAGDGHIIRGTVSDGDANPAEAIFEILTSVVFGLALDISRIDTASFVTAGDTLASEGNGMSQIVDTIRPAEDIIKDILRQCNAVLFENPSGQFTLKLIRNDFSFPSLPIFDETNIINVDSFSRHSWSETQNHINLGYTDRTKEFIDTGAMAQDTANFRTQQQEARADFNYPGVAHPTNAREIAERELLAFSFPFPKVVLTVNREGATLRPGDVIRFSWAKFGLVDMVLRVMIVDFGDLLNGEVKLNCVQDVFRLAETIFSDPNPTDWIPIDTTAVAFTIEQVRATPRLFLNLSFFTEGELDPALGERVQSVAVRPSGPTIQFEQFTDVADGQGFVGAAGRSDGLTPFGTLVNNYPEETPDIEVSDLLIFDDEVDLEVLEDALGAAEISDGNNLGYIEGAAADGSQDEIFGWENLIDNLNGTFTLQNVHRGLMDTKARAHTAGARIFLFSDGQAISDDVFLPAQAITVKHQSETTADDLDVAGAVALPLTFTDRVRRPHHPANATIDSVRFPVASAFTTDLDVAWGHRTNDEQKIADADVVSPKAQDTEVEYVLEFRHMVTAAVLNTFVLDTNSPPPTDGTWLSYIYRQALMQTDTGQVGQFPFEVRLNSRFAAGAVNNPALLASAQTLIQQVSGDIGGAALQSVDLDGSTEFLANTSNNTRGYGNEWSHEIWVKWNALGGGAETLKVFDPTGTNNNRIELSVAAATVGQPFTAILHDSAGTVFKDFDFGSIPAVGVWTQIILTFDGSASGDPLIVIQDGVDVTGSATLNTDTTGTMTNGAGQVIVGVDDTLLAGFLNARVWGISEWTRALTVAEALALWNAGNGSAVNRRFDFGNYAGAFDNQHLWDFRETASIGADFGNEDPSETGSPIDILTNAVGVTAADLVADTP